MTKDNGSPRWAVLLLVLAGVGVDVATLAWIWNDVNMSDPTPVQATLAMAGALVSAALISLGVAIGVVRTRG